MTNIRTYASFADVPRRDYVVTVGTFDGMHVGHRHLLAKAADRASQLNVSMLVITFEPIPAQVLRPETFHGRITTFDQKIGLLGEYGNPTIVAHPFSKAFACTTADTFLADLASAVVVRELWVGEEFALGKDRHGTVDRLQEMADGHGFAVIAVPRATLLGEVVSSSRIRTLIREGEVDEANAMLGRRFSVTGVVCEGAKLGRTIGFPTANVQPPVDLISIADGIYAAIAHIGDSGHDRPAMTYIGTRPALNPGERVIETHLFDFDADIYGQTLSTEFVKRLRPDSNFESIDALVAQMKNDEIHARSILSLPVS